ncbi:hypothetical protein A2V80_00615 [Candidatus Woesebacteria bacterium RBG_16_39_8b]|uniref:Uncharacterized protein n=1 Tax=Candidatus Woesebacteria bacterium RBG_16_39_8b TaxID=1802482 RepID=A0A1F7X814_9BACT|nr:MAG: hypothetical protein A2V80_00615 [Candidatus Woesebacteria bacterium RBG_16_39_8b]
MKHEIKRALPLTPGNLLEAVLDSPILRMHRIRVGRMVDETTAKIPHIVTPPTIEEDVHFWGEKPVERGTKVIIYDAT